MCNRTVTFVASFLAVVCLLVACSAAAAEAPTGSPPTRRQDNDRAAAQREARQEDRETLWIAITNGKRWFNTAFLRDEVARLVEEDRQAELARQQAAEDAERSREPREPRRRSGPAVYGSGACGGHLPSCSIMMCESGGNIHAQNPSSSASGKWQILSSTWNNFHGYPTAGSAPEWVQDLRAAEIWNGGAGRGQWVC